MKKNKMSESNIKKLIWTMGLPMIISMVLQALYNVIDSIFVSNIKDIGLLANLALTYAYPIQILIIAIGVGTGIGINTLLSKSLGEENYLKVNKIAGTGIFLSFIIYLVFLIFGIFGSRWFISLFTNNSKLIEMGSTYLKICTCLSFASIGYTTYERFLQATGKTMLSTISQIAGAITNIILDYIFIYPMNMGVSGAAYATVIGQFVSLILAMYFHYSKNKEINGNIKYIKFDKNLIKEIYKIGISASLMQTLLAIMMAGVNYILGLSNNNQEILTGSFGIYYKIQQVALFSAFGLSNTVISILSFNYGMKDKKRIDDIIKFGILDTVIITFIITIIFNLFKTPLSTLFSLESNKDIINTCCLALKIASLSYIFMGINVSIQGILQSLGYAIKPLIISLLRLIIFVFPIMYLFIQFDNSLNLVWWTFPIADMLTSIISILFLKSAYKEKIKNIGNSYV